VSDITLTVSLIDDLDAESIDFLDIIFRLEKTFNVKLPRGKIIEDSRGALLESEFENEGVVTSAGLVQLKSYLSEVPADRFKTPLYVADIPRLFTPETFLKLVIKAQREQLETTR
jgi:acyl carrier protein